jgi:hypothetical protein
MLMPRQPVPALEVATLEHGNFQLASDAPDKFGLVVFYRGLHCPICLKLLPSKPRKGQCAGRPGGHSGEG